MRGFQTFNPQLNDFNSEIYFRSSDEEVMFVLECLNAAFKFLSNSSNEKRSFLLLTIANKLKYSEETIKEYYCKESGLSASRFDIEFKRTLFQLQSFSDFLLDEFSKTETHTPRESSSPSLTKRNIPIGPVLVLGASNFPLAYSTIGGDSVAALAAGCPVIVKAHPMHVGTSLAVFNCVQEALKETDFPNSIFQHLIDDGYDLVTQLTKDKRIKAIGFTGSIRGGRAIIDLANSRPDPIPVFAEMGSANPVVFLENGFENDIEHYANLFAQSICNDAGQFCTKPGLFFIPKNTFGEQLSSTLQAKISEQQSVAMLHPTIWKNFERLKNERKSTPNSVFFEVEKEQKGIIGKQAILKIDAKDFLKNDALKEEVFGPFAVIISYSNEEELFDCIESLEGQLTASIIANAEKSVLFDRLINCMQHKVGRIILNGVSTGVRVDKNMQHGGPYPASSDSRFSAVGTDSIYRFLRKVTFQNFPC
ncbi:MAG: aldehyde dehydrogenase family protein [Flavobacteriales bacterium]|nr:aldehyde dehydrogenase family protein [Crocinitomicaceae bacterium]NBX79255.1 aldehyde dehydrogenase family protein [Flavobacteriales bacterium]